MNLAKTEGRLALIETCRADIGTRLEGQDLAAIEQYVLDLASGGTEPPKRGRGFDWARVATDAGVSADVVATVRSILGPVLKAYAAPAKVGRAPRRAKRAPGAPAKRPRPPRPIACQPEPNGAAWNDPESFHRALDLHMLRHGDTAYGLRRALLAEGLKISTSTLAMWRRGGKAPQSSGNLAIFARIEHRYRLPSGYFASKRQRSAKALRRPRIPGIPHPEMRRLAWHLPEDFLDRSAADQAEVLAWVREVIIKGTTDYRAFQANALQHRYGLQFRFNRGGYRKRGVVAAKAELSPDRASRSLMAPERLESEMAALVAFKSNALTAPGFRRSGVWGEVTADQRTEHLGLLFGAMAAARNGPIDGLGVPLDDLSFGLLLFPQVWDWYVQWRERRRGFFTSWEVNLLSMGVALAREGTGWIRQTPSLGDSLRPISGLVSPEAIGWARADWGRACDACHAHGLARIKEIERVARVHRDPFEPILPILEAEHPVAEYKKITEEIARRLPDPRRQPKGAAEAVRALLMLRFGLHTGLRQRNLRELMLCMPGEAPRAERWLIEHRRGELRWIERETAWEVYIPSVAFKNAASSFFGSRPFRLQLPDLSDLNLHIDAYVRRHRKILLGGAQDPGTFFVKSAKRTSRTAAYNQTGFYETWRLAIQRYGIFNPYTGLGAIPGLLPHGPHNIRDVLATHILKQTGSYEQASYAIQDTPEMVAKHYGRFLPQDKTTLAARVLNKVWT